MCRLLGYATRRPVSLAGLLGDNDLHAFTQLSSKHCDGWGLAWADDGDGIGTEKAAETALHSRRFAEAAAATASDLGLVHLRLATLGLGVGSENTHPFRHAEIAFAHNGSVSPPESLDEFVPADLQSLRRGTTDSERYFLAALGAARETGTGRFADGLAETAARIAGSLTFGGLNALAITPEELIAVCRYDPDAQDREDEPDYYRLRYRVTEDSVVVSSSGWGEGWSSLGNGELLVVQRHTLALSITPILGSVAA